MDFYNHSRGGPLINVFLRVYFDSLFFFFGGGFVCIIGETPDKRISKGSCLFLLYTFFLVFIGIIGGTPDKRISDGLF